MEYMKNNYLVTLPWAAASVEEDLVTGTCVVGAGNKNNIQLESIGVDNLD